MNTDRPCCLSSARRGTNRPALRKVQAVRALACPAKLAVRPCAGCARAGVRASCGVVRDDRADSRDAARGRRRDRGRGVGAAQDRPCARGGAGGPGDARGGVRRAVAGWSRAPFLVVRCGVRTGAPPSALTVVGAWVWWWGWLPVALVVGGRGGRPGGVAVAASHVVRDVGWPAAAVVVAALDRLRAASCPTGCAPAG